MSIKRPSPRETPPNYPRAYEQSVRLRDGRSVFIRPILPTDAADLADAIRTADADTLHSRFLTGPPTITPGWLRHLTEVDYIRRFALVAADARTRCGVAIARFEPLADGSAEIAVVVTPGWRRIGLATELIQLLAKAAIERGVHTFSVYYLAENRPVAHLIKETGHAGRQLIEQGIAEAVVALDQEGVSSIRRQQLEHDLRHDH